LWLRKTCFVTIHAMQSFNTDPDDVAAPVAGGRKLIVGAIGELQPGACARVALPDGNEIAVCNVDGEYYAIENSCPHRGAPLSDGALYGHVIECGLHGWQFDVRTGECLTVLDRIKTYEVTIEDGVVKVQT
jgi:nitrite reductase/ring-hydroxylating ferredoxin subunit